MSWIAITEAALQRRLSGPEWAALKSAGLAPGQTGAAVLADGIADVTGRVRGYVAGCARNTLGADGTIPSELMTSATALLREYVFTRLPGMKSLYDEIRQKETERALAELRDVAACKFALVQPTTPAAQQPGGPAIELVDSRPRENTRDNLRGL